jgi:hypothetical protein
VQVPIDHYVSFLQDTIVKMSNYLKVIRKIQILKHRLIKKLGSLQKYAQQLKARTEELRLAPIIALDSCK